MIAIVETAVTLARLYGALGLAFAVAFVLLGIQRVDPSARGASWGFRVAVIPGVVLLWPLLALRWLRGRQTPVERNAHRAAATGGAR